MSPNTNNTNMANIVDAASSRVSSARDSASTRLNAAKDAASTRIDSVKDVATNKAKDFQNNYFRITDDVPEAFWYWAALVSIVTSALLFFVGKRRWSTFVGQWPPTFLLFGLFHKLLGPGHNGDGI